MTRTEMEGRIAAIWGDVLEVAKPVRPEDSFFALGGDSLTATIVLFQVNQQLGVGLALTSLMETASLGEFCTRVEAAQVSTAT
jgi:acyl carrier protein